MDVEIIEQPIRFRLLGLSSSVDNKCYGEVGCRLMDAMWAVVKPSGLKTTGINHWVYFADDRMFVGVEVTGDEQVATAKQLESCEFELPRYAKHVHVGQYSELGQKWQSLKDLLATRGESITLPSLEVYGHIPQGDDDSQPETTILMGLKRNAS